MIDFEQSRKDAFEVFKSTNSVQILTHAQAKDIGKGHYAEVWDTVTEISVNENVLMLRMHICFLKDFPLTIPEIFLSKNIFAETKYIPHIDHRGFVCVFDTETITFDPNQPAAIVRKCFIEAKRTIERGISGSNRTDFNEEFKAYWDDQYPSKEKLIPGISLLDSEKKPDVSRLRAFKINDGFREYEVVIHENDRFSEQFQNYLAGLSRKFTEISVLYLGVVGDIYPPFNLSNYTAWDFVKRYFADRLADYEKYLNRNHGRGIIVFSKLVRGKYLIFGWHIPFIATNRSGFRDGAIVPSKSIHTFEKNKSITRIKFEEYSELRLQERTDGIATSQGAVKIAMAGLGSIGSHLLNALVLSGYKKFTLIDVDNLSIENVNRHILGLPYIKTNKAEGLKILFELSDPSIEITAYPTSIINVLDESPSIVNESDLLLVAIGKQNIEEYIVDCRKRSIIQKPILICWVEPYLAGGHYLYINDPTSFEFSSYMKNGYYLYNTIPPEEYEKKDNVLLLREAGCQSSYVPYGKKYINLFISTTIKTVLEIIDEQPTTNKLFSWVGDKKLLAAQHITWSPAIDDKSFGEITFHN